MAFFFADFLGAAFFVLTVGFFLAFPSLKMLSHFSEYFFVVPLCNTVTRKPHTKSIRRLTKERGMGVRPLPSRTESSRNGQVARLRTWLFAPRTDVVFRGANARIFAERKSTYAAVAGLPTEPRTSTEGLPNRTRPSVNSVGGVGDQCRASTWPFAPRKEDSVRGANSHVQCRPHSPCADFRHTECAFYNLRSQTTRSEP